MRIEHATIYRHRGEGRAILREMSGAEHVVSFKAGKSVSFKECVRRALKQIDGAEMAYGARYEGEMVSEWPASVAEVSR